MTVSGLGIWGRSPTARCYPMRGSSVASTWRKQEPFCLAAAGKASDRRETVFGVFGKAPESPVVRAETFERMKMLDKITAGGIFP
ncbi:hypothetical protein [Acetobacter nitrogenifigens]|nr:hypothetical protein [Acetobacter nitrogenifigens]